ncbi:MAG: rubrerythrin [uncultured bacterium]|nr:MAG: rubrerythrin [uncultured bacterium]HBR79220.1 ferritin [Candidatus Moranbacteria bacterium]
MKTYICEICGDAYLGEDRPSQCPFCGAGKGFIKDGIEARPIANEAIEVDERERENLMKTLELEMRAVAIYQCMAGKTDKYEIKAMYKRLAKVELEHATIVTKILKIEKPEAVGISCADSEVENFDETIKLEDDASKLYATFAQEAVNANIKKFFGALTIVEREHIELIEKYI